MRSQGLQCALRHGVHGEGRSEAPDVKNVGGLRVLGSRACPQPALRTCAEVVDTLPARRAQKSARRLVGAFSDGDAKLVAQLVRHFALNGGVPTADEYRCDGGDIGIEPGLDAPLDAAQKRLGGRDVLLAGEQERDIDGYTRKNCLLDRGESFLRPGNLD